MDNVAQFEASTSNFPAFDAFSRLFDVSLRYASMYGVDALRKQTDHACILANKQEKKLADVTHALSYLRDIVSSEGVEEYRLYARRLRVFSDAKYSFHEPDSLDRPIESYDHDTDLSIVDVIISQESPDENARKIEIKKVIAELLNFLSTEERQMLALRFGLGDNDFEQEMTIVSMGKRLGVSREITKRQYERLLNKCRRYFEGKGFTIDDFF